LSRDDAGRIELVRALTRKAVIVVCGSGGVGKTTIAASLGLQAARLGRRTLVCTIDPSRRLATSLGLSRLEGKPRRLDLTKVLEGRGNGGSLHAMALDTKRTFDAVVARYSKDTAARDRILKNRFYVEVSSALAGSQEYMAMERLLELVEDERFDLVVLDTPPTRHALDFLEAPDRMLGFLDTSILRFFLRPYFVAGRLTLKVATRTGALALKLADRAIGLGFLQELSEFFLAFDGMYDGFKERASRVFDLLRDPGSGFVVVASPSPATLGEALFFHERLEEKKMPFVTFIANRMHADPAEASPEPVRGPARSKPSMDDDLRGALVAAFRDQQRLAKSDRRSAARLSVEGRGRVVTVPEGETDIHELRGLADMAQAIFGASRREGAKR
jgi:anion-transporting  ArsA/GET3 family ATPase